MNAQASKMLMLAFRLPALQQTSNVSGLFLCHQVDGLSLNEKSMFSKMSLFIYLNTGTRRMK